MVWTVALRRVETKIWRSFLTIPHCSYQWVPDGSVPIVGPNRVLQWPLGVWGVLFHLLYTRGRSGPCNHREQTHLLVIFVKWTIQAFSTCPVASECFCHLRSNWAWETIVLWNSGFTLCLCLEDRTFHRHFPPATTVTCVPCFFLLLERF